MSLQVPRLKIEKGQGLVEMAIIAPILVFLLIGVFEVGFALRGYLILTNANREAARFAVRQNYLDFNSNDVGYERVWVHAQDSIAGQIDFNEQTGAMIISYISVDAPCTMPYTITTPLDVPTYTWKYPARSVYQTRLDYIRIAHELLIFQISHSCDLIARGFVPVPNNVVIVELFFDQPQLFGFPVISNPLLDPVPMYTHSVFRRIEETRD